MSRGEGKVRGNYTLLIGNKVKSREIRFSELKDAKSLIDEYSKRIVVITPLARFGVSKVSNV
jgi:hypothetical protein